MKMYFLIVIVSFLFPSCEKEVILPNNKIPSEITDFISNKFPEFTIIQAIKDKDGFELTYDITLEGGIFLEFNRKSELIDIEGMSKLPDSIIPDKILGYVATNFAANFITGWELDDRNQQVKLDNGLDLEFNMNGDFLRIDN